MVLPILCALLVGLGGGAGCARLFLRRSQAHPLDDMIADNMSAILSNAHSQREIILNTALKTTQEQHQQQEARLESDRQTLMAIHKNLERSLSEKQSEMSKFENRLAQGELSLKDQENNLLNAKDDLQKTRELQGQYTADYEHSLELKTGVKKHVLLENLKSDLVATEKLGISKWLFEHTESLKADSQKFAKKALDAVYLRYQPRFVWPKSSFVVSVPKPFLQKHFGEDSTLIPLLMHNTESIVSALALPDQVPTMLKITGGAGVDKEIIKLTLEEIVAKEIINPDKIRQILSKHQAQIGRLVLKMGQEAQKILGIEGSLHPEILKLIGSLNYRTSHRQNQYFHSIEVARLAGMLADEIGVDSAVAKRAGLLHDIGKVLDYKIEGSHAVISADYATRFGENEVVVDTVLAHHDDKIVETPFAYILKAADAMSGARPGARVDMEEGYNRRIDGISDVVNSFHDEGVTGSAIMSAGREIHVYVDSAKVRNDRILQLAEHIAHKLESQVEYPGQIRVTVIRRTEITEVA